MEADVGGISDDGIEFLTEGVIEEVYSIVDMSIVDMMMVWVVVGVE